MVSCSVCAIEEGRISLSHGISLCSDKCKERVECIGCGGSIDGSTLLCTKCKWLGPMSSDAHLGMCFVDAVGFLQRIGMQFNASSLSVQEKHVESRLKLLGNRGYIESTSVRYSQAIFWNSFNTCKRNILKCNTPACVQMIAQKATGYTRVTAQSPVDSSYVAKLKRLMVVRFFPSVRLTRVNCDGREHILYKLGSTQTSRGYGTTTPFVKEINIVSGMPYLRATGTLVHELLHAWIFLTRAERNALDVDARTPAGSVGGRAEEALCNYASILFWQSSLRIVSNAEHPYLYRWIQQALNTAIYKPYYSAIQLALRSTSFSKIAVGLALTGCL